MIPSQPQIEKLGCSVHPNDNNNSFLRMVGDIVDGIRQLLTDFGLRQYRVFVITLAWSGSKYGIGTSYIKYVREILPTPKVSDLSFIQRQASTGGIHEEGKIIVSEISINDWTEDELLGTDPITGLTKPNEKRIWLVTEAAALNNDAMASLVSDSIQAPVINGLPDPLAAVDIQATDGGIGSNRNFNTLPKNRAFVQFGDAFLDAMRFQWMIQLEKIEPDFARQGLALGNT